MCEDQMMEQGASGTSGGLNVNSQVVQVEPRKFLLEGVAELVSYQSLREFCTLSRDWLCGCVVEALLICSKPLLPFDFIQHYLEILSDNFACLQLLKLSDG